MSDAPKLMTVPPTPVAHGLWGNMMLALKRPFSISGRSTRAEFWACSLFCVLVQIPFLLLVVLPWFNIDIHADRGEDGFNSQELGCLGLSFLGVVLLLVSIVLHAIPWHAALVRRMHDLGKSCAGVICGLVSGVLSIIAFVLVCKLLYMGQSGGFHGVEAVALLGLAIIGIPALLVWLASLVCTLYLFINSLRPSEKKANKYGAFPGEEG